MTHDLTIEQQKAVTNFCKWIRDQLLRLPSERRMHMQTGLCYNSTIYYHFEDISREEFSQLTSGLNTLFAGELYPFNISEADYVRQKHSTTMYTGTKRLAFVNEWANKTYPTEESDND